MAYNSIHRPTKLVFDKSPAALAEDEASYLLNNERAVAGLQGSLTDTNPLAANYPAGQIVQPAGENYSVGGCSDDITNEDYSLIFNSNGAHYLQRVSDRYGVEIVYDKECLQLSADPQHYVAPFRSMLRLDEVYNKNQASCKNRHGKQFIWTDGLNPIGCIDTEASIATNGFTTPFFDVCPDPCAMIQLCVPEICGAITAEFIPRTLSDAGLSNKLLQKTFKFRIRFIYYDLRASEWSDISVPFYIDDKGCFQDIDSLPRCLRLMIPFGNPMVERIELAFSNGTIADDGVNEIWYLYDTIEKYKKYNNSQEKWYERGLAEIITDNTNYLDDCSFYYTFCNDKECNPIDPKETSRVYNPLPNQPQGILRVKENNFGFYNYIQGNCPVDKTEVEKFNIAVNCQDDQCQPEYATVTVRAVIVESRKDYNQFVYRLGGEMGGDDDPTDVAYYGAAPYGGNFGAPIMTSPVLDMCGQRFNDARNFTAYIEASEKTVYFSEMKQWTAKNGFVNRKEYGMVSGMLAEEETSRRVPLQIINGGYFYQEAIFKVPKGTRGIIRLKAPSSKANDASTSAPIVGTIPINLYESNGLGGSNWDDIETRFVYELEFDTCNGDVELNDAFLIQGVDGYDDEGINPVPYYHYDGYVTDANADQVEGANMYSGISRLATTDHNGYYSIYLRDDDSLSVNVKVEKDCDAFQTVESRVVNGIEDGVSSTDIEITDQAYADGFFETVNVKVLDCDDNPIPGVTVAITEGKAKVTDPSTGIASFKVRNKYTRNKKVRAYVMDTSGCFNLSCLGECSPCMPETNLISLQSCFATKPVTDVNTNEKINIKDILQNQRYLKRGGRYPFGLVFQGDCGKLSAVYELPYVDIPKMQSTMTSAGCLLSYDATGLIAPDWANCMKVVRGINSNPYEIQWLVDKIEKTTDNKIKLTIQSLNDYNENFFFQTNTIYQWLKGDRIEFIRNQDGVILDAGLYGILNYLTLSPFHDQLISGRTDADANYFNQLLIEDDGRIDFLEEGSLIEIQRGKECTTEPVYFQIAAIPIVNNRLLYEQGTIDTFDTYIKKRTIEGRAFQIFEHHSPSDFWGTNLTDAGKVYFTNIYENERRYGRNISVNAVGQFNYFGDLVKTMPATQQGDIIAMSIADGKVILSVCENDNFIAMSADDLLRLGNNGLITALPADAIIGNPEAKISGMYGCRYSDVGSIYFGDGYATWYDGRKYCYVKHDYQIAKAVDYNKVQTYFRTVGVRMDLINKTAIDLDKVRFSTGFNYVTGAVIITNKSLRHSGINNDQKLYETPNSTILFNPDSEDFLTMASFTAERYGNVTLNDGFGCAFLAYLNGIPYIHPVLPEKYNEFFGVPVDRVMALVVNKYPEKERILLAYELQSDMMWFVANVETSDPNYRSEIPPKKVKQFGKKWNAAFLRNINSVGGLFGGKEASDYWIRVTFVRDNTDQLKYGTIDNLKRVKFDSVSHVLFRFQLSEQSGFPEQG